MSVKAIMTSEGTYSKNYYGKSFYGYQVKGVTGWFIPDDSNQNKANFDLSDNSDGNFRYLICAETKDWFGFPSSSGGPAPYYWARKSAVLAKIPNLGGGN